MSTPPIAYAHIPGLQLAPDASIPLGTWSLRPVPFDEWTAMEDPSLEAADNRYRSVAPVFLTGSIDVAGPLREEAIDDVIESTVGAAARRVSSALLFSLWVALPAPERSARYLQLTDGRGWARQFGANERELLLVGEPPYATLSPEQVAPFVNMFTHLTEVNAGDETPELMRLIDTVRLSLGPDRDFVDLVVHFVAAHEDTFNRAQDAPLGKAFARRLAALFCADFEQMGGWAEAFEALYDVRSGALHGRDVSGTIGWLGRRFQDPGQFLVWHCYLTCSRLAFLTHVHGGLDAGLNQLVGRLDRAAADRAEHAALRGEFARDWLRS